MGNNTGRVVNYRFGAYKKYTGTLEKGEPHGFGTVFITGYHDPCEWDQGPFENWEKHTGTWEHGKKHGNGVTTYKRGYELTAMWDNNNLPGSCTVHYPGFRYEKGTYVGSWNWDMGWRTGQGTMEWSNGRKYVGNWSNNYRSGQGTMEWPDGRKYVGNWSNDQMSGEGTMEWTDGRKYVGNWSNDQMHGEGTMTSPDGAKYVGNWSKDKMSGQGTMEWSNGRKYVGNWEDDKMHGEGLLIDGNARSHGYFRKGVKHGIFHVSVDGQPPEQKHFVFGEPLEGNVSEEGGTVKINNDGEEGYVTAPPTVG